MNTYDVELCVTVRIESPGQGDAKVQAYLMAEEKLYGAVMMPPAGQTTVPKEQLDERIGHTGIDLRVVGCERVVTAKLYPVT